MYHMHHLLCRSVAKPPAAGIDRTRIYYIGKLYAMSNDVGFHLAADGEGLTGELVNRIIKIEKGFCR
jgi:hypothetical protein